MVDIEVGESRGRDLSQTYGVVSAAASFKFIARLGITASHQILPRPEIWFGTRGRRFKSFFPDQFFPTTYGSGEHLETNPPGFGPSALALEPA